MIAFILALRAGFFKYEKKILDCMFLYPQCDKSLNEKKKKNTYSQDDRGIIFKVLQA